MPEISRRQFAVYLVAVVLVVVLGGRALRADVGGALPGTGPAGAFGAAAEPGPSPTPPGATGATGPGVEMGADETPVLVHVAGAVARPGVYELPGDARIRDAVEEAGGGRKGADLDALNLAAKISDGQQVLVRRHAPAGASPAGA
ncbi:MAG: ComEA family DNA-binding protein, partial [Solirubrobacterales bacterium]|nr:ComEA family DNA-binding protein [Solirubrobacterales bacterium]